MGVFGGIWGYMAIWGYLGMYPQMTPGYRGLRGVKASIASRGYLGLFEACIGPIWRVSTGGAPEGHLGGIRGCGGLAAVWWVRGVEGVSGGPHSMYTRALVYMEWRC